jgi:hypothetical protein
MLDVMQSLWIGNRLSAMEKMSINSFIKNGHPFHLYTYAHVDNVPDGVEIKDAEEIIPTEQIFTVRGGFSSFSDFFRWRLVQLRGGWWVDTDAICLKPFEFPGDYVFVGGTGVPGSDDCVSSGMFKAPAHCELANWAWEECLKMDPKTMPWGAAGPPLITQAVHKFEKQNCIFRGKLFFPIFYTKAPQVFIGSSVPAPEETLALLQAYSLHWFNEMWRMAGQDKDATYPPGCLYEIFKRKYL